jgi:hypothetical protein
MVDWNTEILHKLLKQVVAQRVVMGKKEFEQEPAFVREEDMAICDEVADFIDLPGFVFRRPQDPDMIELSPEAKDQLRNFVCAVANAYHNNPFNCLQRASAVTLHLSKLLSRIVVNGLDGIQEEDEDEDDDFSDSSSESGAETEIASHLHNHSYGITSDPLTQFALVLSAFIHVVDHTGLSNEQLVKEDPETAALYKNRSIIEQRSIEKAWKKLMEPAFSDLRKCIYSDDTELQRFRHVVVNSVLATDNSAELQNLRMSRWEKTFGTGAYNINREDVNRKATIVLEYLMQASTVFHTMQPWIVYEKWCSKDFEEQHLAFKNGRTKEDPSLTWYQDELDLFDNYAIPLAMQLKDCDAFVVSSDEYLSFALKNRQYLATKGKTLVPAILDKINAGNTSTNGIPSEPTLSAANATETVTPHDEEVAKEDKNMQRLATWNAEILKQLLKQIVARRQALGLFKVKDVPLDHTQDKNIVDEVAELIEFPPFDPSVSSDKLNSEFVDLGSAVEEQILKYVQDILGKFKKNEFHGVDHGSQVCMNTKKMLSRISTIILTSENIEHAASDLDNRTFGISSDPLAQFSVVFASLISGLEHEGVPNSQLVREGHPLASKYSNRCISEQHSIATAWEHLMQPKFEDLRGCIFSDATELKRFRQIIVNCVLSMDSSDEEMILLRKTRWDKAFVRGRHDNSIENRNRRATIVLEVLTQASDVFHATQNWHLYQKWNERHFTQAYTAFKKGRLMQDPSIFWYKSELLFFDEHVVQVCRCLAEIGVFGSTGDEFLSCALGNRQQWAAKGGDQVASMMARYHGKEIEKVRTKRAYRRMSLSAFSA